MDDVATLPETATAATWGRDGLRQRVATCLDRIQAKLGEAALAQLRDRAPWQALTADLDLGHRLLSYLDGVGIDDGDPAGRLRDRKVSPDNRALIGQCALFLAGAARNLAVADMAVAVAARRLLLRKLGLAIAAVLAVSALVYGIWRDFFAKNASPDFFDGAFAELAAHPVNALLFAGCGMALVHWAERHRHLPGLVHRIIATMPVMTVFAVVTAVLVSDLLRDLGMVMSGQNLWFDIKCLGLGLGATYLVRAYCQFRKA